MTGRIFLACFGGATPGVPQARWVVRRGRQRVIASSSADGAASIERYGFVRTGEIFEGDVMLRLDLD